MYFTHEEGAMLAEIFFLRLEAMLRASAAADRTKAPRLVPLPAVPLLAFRERQAREAYDGNSFGYGRARESIAPPS